MKYRAYKYRLYPNEEQKVLIAKHLGSCRFIYNYALDKKVRAYQTDKTNLSRFDIQADLPNMKKSEEYCWLKEVNSLSLQASLANLDSAYTKFFREHKGFPRFKRFAFRNINTVGTTEIYACGDMSEDAHSAQEAHESSVRG